MAQILHIVRPSKNLGGLRLWNPRDRYPIDPMEPTPAEIRVAFSFVERNKAHVWRYGGTRGKQFYMLLALLLPSSKSTFSQPS